MEPQATSGTVCTSHSNQQTSMSSKYTDQLNNETVVSQLRSIVRELVSLSDANLKNLDNFNDAYVQLFHCPQIEHTADLCGRTEQLETEAADAINLIDSYAHLISRVIHFKGRLEKKVKSVTEAEQADENDSSVHELCKTFRELKDDIIRYDCYISQASKRLEELYESLQPCLPISRLFEPRPGDKEPVECTVCFAVLEDSMLVKQCPKCSKYCHDHCMEIWLKTKEDNVMQRTTY